MNKTGIAIIGCGDIGSRIAGFLLDSGVSEQQIYPIVGSRTSKNNLSKQYNHAIQIDLDEIQYDMDWVEQVEEVFYLVPPQKNGIDDLRTHRLIHSLYHSQSSFKRMVVISTTGVYGDCHGKWVTEETPINPTTLRSQRRLSMEQQWQDYASEKNILLSILRVPGIYSFSRLPKERLESGRPIVNPAECGYTNRIHADDLAKICINVMKHQRVSDVYNASDGRPGKMSEYFLEVAKFLGIQRPPVISFSEAERKLSSDMMSYLKESRKISNQKIIQTFNLELQYPDFRQGIQH